MKAKRWVACGVSVAALLVCGSALADKVLVLPLQGVGTAASAQLPEANAATSSAVTKLSHKVPTQAEIVKAQAAVKDGVADTKEEYLAAGKASTSDWTLTGQVEDHGATYRIELEACQVESGRVESLAREIDPAQATTQISEMLVFLIRPQGIANATIPWERTSLAPKPPPPPPEPPKPPPPPPTPPPPPPPPKPPEIKHWYGEQQPFALGLTGTVLGTLHSDVIAGAPSSVVGSAAGATLGGTGAYAFPTVPGLELRADMDGSIAGPKSFSFAGGARWAFPIMPTVRLYAGPELELGTLVTLGAVHTARFLLRGDAFVALGFGQHIQLEAAAVFDVAAGSSALDLAGGTLRALVRF